MLPGLSLKAEGAGASSPVSCPHSARVTPWACTQLFLGLWALRRPWDSHPNCPPQPRLRWGALRRSWGHGGDQVSGASGAWAPPPHGHAVQCVPFLPDGKRLPGHGPRGLGNRGPLHSGGEDAAVHEGGRTRVRPWREPGARLLPSPQVPGALRLCQAAAGAWGASEALPYSWLAPANPSPRPRSWG